MIWRKARNCEAVPLAELEPAGFEEFREAVAAGVRAGFRISALFGCPERRLGGEEGRIRIFAALTDDFSGLVLLACSSVRESFQSLTPDCPQAHMFEREIHEQWGPRPEGHPWLKPVRFHDSYEGGRKSPEVGCADFFRIHGEEVHEVAVGPVHAGIIEPGHFRFQCHGENVHHLEISLGYQHRGVERALAGGPDRRTIHLMETLAGDTTAGHAAAYCQALEALAGRTAPPAALSLRGIALELERMANHTGDLGALANDVGYLPTASFCGRLRGDFLNMTALLCGNRFGRGLVAPFGSSFGLDGRMAADLTRRLDSTFKDVENAAGLLWDTSSVMSRFEGTGRISTEACLDLGIVGPAARASGVDRDVRRDFPSGVFRFVQIPVSTWETGDVFGRAIVRWLEIRRSAEFVRRVAASMPAGDRVAASAPALAPSAIAVSLVEGWRGEICHAAVTDRAGKFAVYKVVDPSFHNWFGLAMALRGQQISDFPLCNKSFNLSYCGHDL